MPGRKNYLNPHVLGALCLACDVEPGGNSYQEMGEGFTQAKIDELEQVTGPGIRNLQVLCGLHLNWRTVGLHPNQGGEEGESGGGRTARGIGSGNGSSATYG